MDHDHDQISEADIRAFETLVAAVRKEEGVTDDMAVDLASVALAFLGAPIERVAKLADAWFDRHGPIVYLPVGPRR